MSGTKRGAVRLALAVAALLPASTMIASPGGASATVSVARAAADVPAVAAPPSPQPIKDRYIAVFRNRDVSRSRVRAVVEELRKRYRLLPGLLYFRALRGFAFTATPAQARALAEDRRVEFVQPDYRVFGSSAAPQPTAGTQYDTPSWGIDRIDQRNLPLNHTYKYPDTAPNVTAYIIDSGVLTTHQEFQGRAVSGANFVQDGRKTDCNGHGTHVAGTVGGITVGVAKAVHIVSLRVLGCDNTGSTSGIIAGVDWVAEKGRRPGVVNMSLGRAGADEALKRAVTSIGEAGFLTVVAAGNEDSNACAFSPAAFPNVATIGAIKINDQRDTAYSNYGPCVKSFAPGTNIFSASNKSNTDYATMSGTSMASPHVAGAAALILSRHTGFSPKQVGDCLERQTTKGVLSDVGNGSPNSLVYVNGTC